MSEGFELQPYLPSTQVTNDVHRSIGDEQVQKIIENYQFSLGYTICGHCHLGKDKKHEICTNEAGLNTIHVGTGMCFKHDHLPGVEVSPYTRQLFEYPTLQSLFEEFKNRGREIKKLDEELALARSVLADQLAQLRKGKSFANNDIYRNIILCLEMVRKLSESMAKIEQIQSQGITLEAISAFLWQVMSIMNEEIIDQDKSSRIFDRISTECKFVQSVG